MKPITKLLSIFESDWTIEGNDENDFSWLHTSGPVTRPTFHNLRDAFSWILHVPRHRSVYCYKGKDMGSCGPNVVKYEFEDDTMRMELFKSYPSLSNRTFKSIDLNLVIKALHKGHDVDWRPGEVLPEDYYS